ncbi:hypothetical protein AGMMS49975_09150 [Clostridia bacterium]|nr:hypothetical protein AGMMS49975_09150 [Clostridia bacterium]
MPFVPVPKDLNKIKTKLAFNLTKRQLLAFGAAAAVGIPTYFLGREGVGNSTALLIMVAVMLPFGFLGLYENSLGMPFEQVLKHIIISRYIRPPIRIHKTQNYYGELSREVKKNAVKRGEKVCRNQRKQYRQDRKIKPTKIKGKR